MFARFPTLRDFPWVNLPLVLLGLTLSGVAVWRAYRREEFRGKVLAPVAFSLSLFLAVAFSGYVFWLSYLLPAPSETAMGLVRAPDFALPSASGETVRLSDYRGRKVVLVFYRGFW